MNAWAAKRFWENATVELSDTGFAVKLDGRGVKTPAKSPLIVPTRGLADAIAAEWQAQDETVNPETMPFTRSANSALDRVAVQFTEVANLIADYAATELLCYRADAPKELVERQAEQWDPFLEWANGQFGASLSVGSGIMHVAQDAEEVAKLQKFAFDLSAFEMTGFYDLVSLSGSYILACAVMKAHVLPEQAWSLSRIEEEWQIEQWGVDDEAESTDAIKKSAFLHAFEFVRLSRKH